MRHKAFLLYFALLFNSCVSAVDTKQEEEKDFTPTFTFEVPPAPINDYYLIPGDYIYGIDSLYKILRSSIDSNCSAKYRVLTNDLDDISIYINVYVSKNGYVKALDVITADSVIELTPKIKKCILRYKTLINSMQFRPSHEIASNRISYVPIDDTIEVPLPFYVEK